MDSKILQSPPKTATCDGEDVCFFSGLCVCLDQNIWELLCDETQTSSEGVAATALVYVKFGVQSCLKINTCVCLSDFLCGFQQGKKQNLVRSK